MGKYKEKIKESREKIEEIEKLNNDTINELDGLIDSAGAAEKIMVKESAETPVGMPRMSTMMESNPMARSMMSGGSGARMSMALPSG